MAKKRRLFVEPLEALTMLSGNGIGPAADVCSNARNNPNCAVIGDSDGDGAFTFDDLSAVMAAGKFETGDCAEWSEGDWNRDGVFNSEDFTYAFSDGQLGVPADLAIETFIPGLAGKTCPPGQG